jgi:hypothetical protein
VNKQQGLEALLVKMREWEHPDKEVRDTRNTASVLAALDRNIARLNDLREAEEFGVNVNSPDVDSALITIGAAALSLLVDEVKVVTGRSLEEWLADNRDRVGNGGRSKLRRRPQPVNGDITLTPHIEVHTEPNPLGLGRRGAPSWWPEGMR